MQSYQIGTGNYTKEGVLRTEFIDRLSYLNIPFIFSTMSAWRHWKKRTGKPDDYYPFDHPTKYRTVIEESINEVLQHYDHENKLWIEIWNEPDWWLAPTTFWPVNDIQTFHKTWETAYHKIKGFLSFFIFNYKKVNRQLYTLRFFCIAFSSGHF